MKTECEGEAESAGNSELEQLGFGFSAAGKDSFPFGCAGSREPALLSLVERSVFRPARALLGGLRHARSPPYAETLVTWKKCVLLTTLK